jgi:hypothetical protein
MNPAPDPGGPKTYGSDGSGSATMGAIKLMFSRIFDAIKLKLTPIYVRRRELHNDTGSEASQESGIFSTGSSQESPRKEAAAAARRPGAGQADRRPGLGRRAITQINLKERKNSYNSALARSQENLVQVIGLPFFCTVPEAYLTHFSYRC